MPKRPLTIRHVASYLEDNEKSSCRPDQSSGGWRFRRVEVMAELRSLGQVVRTRPAGRVPAREG